MDSFINDLYSDYSQEDTQSNLFFYPSIAIWKKIVVRKVRILNFDLVDDLEEFFDGMQLVSCSGFNFLSINYNIKCELNVKQVGCFGINPTMKLADSDGTDDEASVLETEDRCDANVFKIL